MLVADAREAVKEQAPLDRVRSLTTELQQVFHSLGAGGPAPGGAGLAPGGGHRGGAPAADDDVIDADFTTAGSTDGGHPWAKTSPRRRTGPNLSPPKQPSPASGGGRPSSRTTCVRRSPTWTTCASASIVQVTRERATERARRAAVAADVEAVTSSGPSNTQRRTRSRSFRGCGRSGSRRPPHPRAARVPALRRHRGAVRSSGTRR